MEEIVSTDALEKEILNDARRKAEKVLHDADAESLAVKRAAGEKTQRLLSELEADYGAKMERIRRESLARIPLEKARIKASFIDGRLCAAIEERLSTLPPERLFDLIRRGFERSLDTAGPERFSSGAALRWKGVSAKAVEALVATALPGLPSLSVEEDPNLPGPGFCVASADGNVRLAATLDLVVERLLDEERGPLAKALCAGALAL